MASGKKKGIRVSLRLPAHQYERLKAAIPGYASSLTDAIKTAISAGIEAKPDWFKKEAK